MPAMGRTNTTQALLELFTIREQRGTISGLTVALVGDILHSRVARSDIFGLTKLGARVIVCGPATLIPVDVEKLGAKLVEKGLAAESELEGMTDQQVMQHIFAPGFSTAQQVTSVSGRGVGMDVVRTNIEKIAFLDY